MSRVLQTAWWTSAPHGRVPRSPWSVLRRGLVSGALGGALLGAGLQASDVYYRSWATVALGGVIGALVALPAALAAVIVYQAVEAKGVRLAWLACSLAAAAGVVGNAAALGVLDAAFTGVCAAAAFLTALLAAPSITTRRVPTTRPT